MTAKNDTPDAVQAPRNQMRSVFAVSLIAFALTGCGQEQDYGPVSGQFAGMSASERAYMNHVSCVVGKQGTLKQKDSARGRMWICMVPPVPVLIFNEIFS